METDKIRELRHGARENPVVVDHGVGGDGNGRAGAEDEFGDDVDAEMMDLVDRAG